MIPNKTFYLVSDSAHFFFALSMTLLSRQFSYYIAGLVLIFAVIKEAWWDEKYESPDVRGSGLRDFLGYALGVIVGIGVLSL